MRSSVVLPQPLGPSITNTRSTPYARPHLALLLALERLVDGAADGVRRLRRGQDALGARELDGRLERRDLGDGPRLDDALVVELADQRRHAVVAEAAGVHGCGHEGVAERVH